MKHMRHNAREGANAAAPERADELDWIALWQSDRVPAALDRLVRAHASVIRAMARAWSSDAHRREDLVSEGNLALIACIDGFVPRDGIPFFAYARPFVRAAMRREMLRGTGVVATPLDHVRAAREGRLGARALLVLQGAARPARIEDIAGWEPHAPGDTPEQAMIRTEEAETRRRMIAAALSSLDETERFLVERWLDGRDLTLAGIADIAGMSVERARRIEGRAFARMKAQFIRMGVTSAGLGDQP